MPFLKRLDKDNDGRNAQYRTILASLASQKWASVKQIYLWLSLVESEAAGLQ